MTPFGWKESDFDSLPPVPDSSDPADIARFVDQRVRLANKVLYRLLTEHMDRRFAELSAHNLELRKTLMSAFPGENLLDHRIYHERAVATQKSLVRVKLQVWAAVVGATILGAATGVGWAVIHTVLALIGRGTP